MKKKKKYFGVLSVVAVVSAVLMAAIFLFQLNNYEKAFLDLYGMEQDGYVKVTLDQIGRLGEDATEEEITEEVSEQEIQEEAEGGVEDERETVEENIY